MHLCLAELLTCVQLKQEIERKIINCLLAFTTCRYLFLINFEKKLDYICMSLGLKTNFVS